MTYWHMQLHPDDRNWGREVELLKKTNLIGLGEWEEGQSQIYQFKNEMKIGDIVLIKRGATSIALTEVIGDFEESENTGLDWFKYRRKVKVLNYASEHKFEKFPQHRGTLQKSITESSITYKYIDNWYKLLNPDKNNFHGYKISKIYIEKFKMFKDFNISFLNDEEILPICIVAGINGSGKTTLLEYISNFVKLNKEVKNESFIKIKNFSENRIETINYQNFLNETKSIETEYNSNIIEYLPTNTHKNLKNIDESIKIHLNKLVWNERESVEYAYKDISENIKKVFQNLTNFDIQFYSLENGETIKFSNKWGDIFTLEELSTGQKTIFTKILYLYMNNIKNRIILIDEPEISLHPSWQNKIFEIYYNFALQNNCQVIIATHSPNIIANTPHKYIKILYEENNKIVVKSLNHAPLDRDLNTIIKTIMGADYIPQYLEEKHEKYRNLCMHGEEDSEEAKKLKLEILEYESPNSSFFQGLAFDMELMR